MRRSLVAALLAIVLLALPVQAQVLTPGSMPALVGSWERRDFSMVIDDAGFARARWKMGSCLEGNSKQPCDRMIDGGQFWGGAAQMVFTELSSGSPLTARGYVTVSTSSVFSYGEITFVQVADDLAMLEQPGQGVLWICKKTRDLNACGP